MTAPQPEEGGLALALLDRLQEVEREREALRRRSAELERSERPERSPRDQPQAAKLDPARALGAAGEAGSRGQGDPVLQARLEGRCAALDAALEAAQAEIAEQVTVGDLGGFEGPNVHAKPRVKRRRGD